MPAASPHCAGCWKPRNLPSHHCHVYSFTAGDGVRLSVGCLPYRRIVRVVGSPATCLLIIVMCTALQLMMVFDSPWDACRLAALCRLSEAPKLAFSALSCVQLYSWRWCSTLRGMPAVSPHCAGCWKPRNLPSHHCHVYSFTAGDGVRLSVGCLPSRRIVQVVGSPATCLLNIVMCTALQLVMVFDSPWDACRLAALCRVLEVPQLAFSSLSCVQLYSWRWCSTLRGMPVVSPQCAGCWKPRNLPSHHCHVYSFTAGDGVRLSVGRLPSRRIVQVVGSPATCLLIIVMCTALQLVMVFGSPCDACRLAALCRLLEAPQLAFSSLSCVQLYNW